MNIKIHSSELNRMMKTITKCIDSRDDNLGNIEIICDNNLLSIRAANGQFAAVMSTPLLGGDGESFCVDGTMFSRVCAMCNGDINIVTDGKVCTIKGAGKTRLPIVNAKIPAFQRVDGNRCTVKAEDFSKAFAGVSHAISADQTRITLTGVHAEVTDGELMLTALDGFRLAKEPADCNGDPLMAVVPGAFMSLVAGSICAGETVTITTDGKRIQAETDGTLLSCGLLAGTFPPTDKMIPESFKTEVLIGTEALRNALKGSTVINNANKLVTFCIEDGKLTVMNNSEQAAYEAEIECDTHGEPINIAFNQKYIMDTINSVDMDTIVLKMNTPTSPAIIVGQNIKGMRLVLPVRTAV